MPIHETIYKEWMVDWFDVDVGSENTDSPTVFRANLSL